MASWVGMSRSNYFRVKDEAAFRSWAEDLDLAVLTDDKGRFGIHATTADGGWPCWLTDEGDEEVEIDLAAELAPHLANGEIAILMEIGYENTRHMTGRAVALNNEGNCVEIELSDIYEKAAALFGIDVDSISAATY